MPLLISPIDGSPMRQITRHGIEIDVCPATGGVWLDKGELEKLLAIIQEEAGAVSGQAQASRYAPQQPMAYREYDDDDDDYKCRGKKRKMSKLMDIFDF